MKLVYAVRQKSFEFTIAHLPRKMGDFFLAARLSAELLDWEGAVPFLGADKTTSESMKLLNLPWKIVTEIRSGLFAGVTSDLALLLAADAAMATGSNSMRHRDRSPAIGSNHNSNFALCGSGYGTIAIENRYNNKLTPALSIDTATASLIGQHPRRSVDNGRTRPRAQALLFNGNGTANPANNINIPARLGGKARA